MSLGAVDIFARIRCDRGCCFRVGEISSIEYQIGALRGGNPCNRVGTSSGEIPQRRASILVG